MDTILAPSLLSADFTNLDYTCSNLEAAGVKWLHLDVMDGSFVPNITFGMPLIKSLRKKTNLFFDVHLMIDEPGRYIDRFAEAGSDLIVIHLETAAHPQLALLKIIDRGLRTGIALNPSTDFYQLRWLLPYVDLIVVMGVNPGFSGQDFIPQTTEKIKCLREWLNDMAYSHIPIEVDGGVTLKNAAALAEAGANVLVSGSAFFSIKNDKEAVKKFTDAVENVEIKNSAMDNVITWRHG